MEIVKKLAAAQKSGAKGAPVTVAFIGDSVTKGGFETHYRENFGWDGVCEQERSFSRRFEQILNYLYPDAQLKIINAGVGGDTATGGVARFDDSVGGCNPDLVVIGFALNDSCKGEEGKRDYEAALNALIDKSQALGAQCVLLTPNMMCDGVSPSLSGEKEIASARDFMRVDLAAYVDIIKSVAARRGVIVCDVYGKWKALKENGVSVTHLLANALNHPKREMHWLIAYELVRTLFEN